MAANYEDTRAAFFGNPEIDSHNPDRRDIIALHLKQGLSRFATIAAFKADTTAVYSGATSRQVTVAAGDIIGAGRILLEVAASDVEDQHEVNSATTPVKVYETGNVFTTLQRFKDAVARSVAFGVGETVEAEGVVYQNVNDGNTDIAGLTGWQGFNPFLGGLTEAQFIAADLTAYPDGTIVRAADALHIKVTGALATSTASIKDDWEYVAFPTVAGLIASVQPMTEGDAKRADDYRYEVAAAGATDQHITSAGGAKLYVVGDEYSVSAFPTPESAITAAAADGVALKGVPSTTYTFETGVTITDQPFIADFTGCNLVRSAAMSNRSILKVLHSFSADTYDTATALIGYSVVDYDFANGATAVPRIELSDVSGYAVGDFVRVFSADKIPSISPWEDTRYAEAGEIGAIVGNYLYLIRPFAETWTPAKIVKMTDLPVRITGGDWYDETGYPVARNQPAIQLYGCVRPRYRNMHMRDTASTQIALRSCYEPLSQNNRFDRARHSIVNSAYSYGEKHVGSIRPVQDGATGARMRHIFDTGGASIADGDLATADLFDFGGVVQATVKNGVGTDSINAPFNDHPDAFETLIENCRSLYTNRAAPGATLFGLQLRGRGSKAVGGWYDGLNPLRVEPSTSIKNVLKNVIFTKYPSIETDASREALVRIEGGGVIGGGKARVVFDDARLSQVLGRKELVAATNASITFSGSIDYAAGLSNPVGFLLDDASDLTISGLDADFRDSTDITPMLVFLEDAGSSVSAPGRVSIKGATGGGSSIVLTDFNSLAGSADWFDVYADGALFGSESGWRNGGSAALRRAAVRRTDTASFSGNTTANFSSGSGAKTIAWPLGAADREIYAAINPTTTGTYPGTIPAGVFTGQRLILSNVGSFDFTVQTTGNISVGATRTVAIGASIILRWDGASWAG